MTALSSFEVLSQPLIPNGPATIPYVVQAYFVQVSYPTGESADTVTFSLTFEETTNFTTGLGQSGVMAQYIDEGGNVVPYPTFISTSTGPFGFLDQQISPGQTKIYSVNVVFPPASAAAMPQSGTGWRGVASLNPSTSGLLVATPTERQIYFTGDLQTITDSVVYSVPTVSGGTRI
jgi:hypothetical protein